MSETTFRETAETLEGWHLWYDPYGPRFDSPPADRSVEVRRMGEKTIDIVNAASLHPAFNIYGLLWREME